jgi:branched-chain amino acid transport system ATP-binding protein
LATVREGRAPFRDFATRALDYVEFARRHMRCEERELMPLARKHLTAEDWAGIDAAFGRNEDPLFGAARRREFDELFRRITELAPMPMGLAPPGA